MRWILAAIVLASPRPSHALFDAARQDLLGAASAGQAGADVAAPGGAGALYSNPAGLPEGDALQLGLFGSAAAGLRQGQGGLGLAGAVDEELRLGLAYDGVMDQRLGGQSEQSLAGLAAAELLPGWTLGLRVKAHRLEAPGLAEAVWGGSLDLGVRVGLRSPAGLPGQGWLGLALDHVAGAWPDEAWARAVPSAARLGASYQPRAELLLSVEAEWTGETAARASSAGWRAGAQWEALPGWRLRAGWRGGEEQASAGLGLPLWSGAGLDYAALYAPARGALGHRLSMSVALETPPERRLRVVPELWLQDPESGEVRQAAFRVDIDARLKASAWRLELRDPQGRDLRTLRPTTVDERSLAWDGLDEQGASVKGDVIYVLVVDTPLGELRKQGTQALALAAARLRQAGEGAGKPAAGLPRMSLRPVLDGREGGRLSHVVVELQGEQREAARAWKVDFQDARGASLRGLQGQGAAPGQLVWDGKDAAGVKVADTLGVKVRLEVVDASGTPASLVQPLFTQEAYARALADSRQRPEMRLAGLGLPLMAGRSPLIGLADFFPDLARDAERREQGFEAGLRAQSLRERRERHQHQVGPQAWDMDIFEPGQAELKPELVELLDFVDAAVREGKSSEVWIYGLASNGEAGGDALARQRAVALARYMRKHGSYGVQLVLSAPEGPDKVRGVRLELH